MMGRFVTFFLVIFISLSPLALGSNRPLPWAYNAVLTGVVALLCCVLLWVERHTRVPLRFGILTLPIGLWMLALAWAGFQLVPLQGSKISHPSWNLAAAALEDSLPGTISVNVAETRAALMRFLTYAVVFMATYILARDAKRASFILRGLILAAAVYALYGLLRYATGVDKILWFDQPSASYLTATYISRNSAATYFGLATCVSFAYLLRCTRRLIQEADAEGTAKRGLEKLVSGLAGAFGLELALFVLLFTATLLTQSRAGVVATLLALLLGLLFHWLRQSQKSNSVATAPVIVIGLIAGLAVLQISGASVAERLVNTASTAESRFDVYADTTIAIFDHAWSGTGLGTFQDVFPIYRNSTLASSTIWDKAHNDYLEVILGLGIPAGGAIIIGIGWLNAICARGVFTRRRNSHMSMAGTMAGVLVAVHAMFDFSLQIQAVALTFAVILAVAAAQSFSDRPR